MLKLAVKPLSIAEFVTFLDEISGFSFARYGDGSFFCLWGKKGQTCDGSLYSSQKALSLIETLKDSTIAHGLGNLALETANAEEWLLQNQIDIEWYDANVINTAAELGKLSPFIRYLQKRKIIFCGPEHLRRFKGFPIDHFIACHPTQAFEEVDELELEISYQVECRNADTVLLSTGTFASPVLVSRLHKFFPSLNIIDTGSVWDRYVGVYSRRLHRKWGLEGAKRLGWLNFNQDITEW